MQVVCIIKNSETRSVKHFSFKMLMDVGMEVPKVETSIHALNFMGLRMSLLHAIISCFVARMLPCFYTFGTSIPTSINILNEHSNKGAHIVLHIGDSNNIQQVT